MSGRAFSAANPPNLARCRLALGLSQVVLAARAGMTQPALSRLEAGGVVPTIPLLERISAAFDADLIVEIAPHAA
jgi:transcriptional regulator with XRE-family HTH domain